MGDAASPARRPCNQQEWPYPGWEESCETLSPAVIYEAVAAASGGAGPGTRCQGRVQYPRILSAPRRVPGEPPEEVNGLDTHVPLDFFIFYCRVFPNAFSRCASTMEWGDEHPGRAGSGAAARLERSMPRVFAWGHRDSLSWRVQSCPSGACWGKWILPLPASHFCHIMQSSPDTGNMK